MNLAFLAFNTNRKYLKQAKIRKALSLAIDKKTILQAVYYKSAVQTSTLLSEQSWALKPYIKDHGFDSALAKKQLKALNYDFSKTLSILIPENADFFNPNFHKTAELIQANFADIGIKSNIIELSAAALQTRLLKGN